MNNQTRTWVIVGFDILLVLLVYLMYNFLLKPAVNQESQGAKSVTQHRKINYSLQAKPAKKNKVKLTFELWNTAENTAIVAAPRGITLMLSDGQKYIYDQKQIVPPGRLTIPGGGEKKWVYLAPYPDNTPQVIYAGYFLDQTRQKQVRVDLNKNE